MEFKVNSLWRDNKAYLPELLSKQYIEKLVDIGMYEHAKAYVRKEGREGAVGGESLEETHQHFAERFTNSCIRLQYVLIDPSMKFGDVPDNFYSTFITGDIALLDAPCGTGAAALSLLFTLKELRSTGELPNLPLNISILASDYSKSALEMYEEMLQKAIPQFNQVGISVNVTLKQWNAFEVKSTQLLMDEYKKIKAEEYFVLISAFSGIDNNNLEKLSHSITHMQGCLSTEHFTIVHIEPETKKGDNFFKKIKEIYRFIFLSGRNLAEFKPKERFEWLDPVNSRTVKSSVMISINSRDEIE